MDIFKFTHTLVHRKAYHFSLSLSLSLSLYLSLHLFLCLSPSPFVRLSSIPLNTGFRCNLDIPLNTGFHHTPKHRLPL